MLCKSCKTKITKHRGWHIFEFYTNTPLSFHPIHHISVLLPSWVPRFIYLQKQVIHLGPSVPVAQHTSLCHLPRDAQTTLLSQFHLSYHITTEIIWEGGRDGGSRHLLLSLETGRAAAWIDLDTKNKKKSCVHAGPIIRMGYLALNGGLVNYP